LAAEVLIASFAHDLFVRPYLGDVLVVMLLFFAVRAFWQLPPLPLAMGVLCFAVVVEATQALGLIRLLGWSDNTLAKLVMGNTFQWGDLVCYLIGSVASLSIFRVIPSRRQAT
jgi:hypothetical protein